MPRYRSSQKIDALIEANDKVLRDSHEATSLYGDDRSGALCALMDSADALYSEDTDGWIEAYQLGVDHRAMRKPVWCVSGLGAQGDTVAFWYGSEGSVLARIRAAIARGIAADATPIDDDE